MNTKLTAVCAFFCACSAFGAGFQVLEQGASNIGTAMAGATANANSDAATAFWNPSAAAFMKMTNGEVKLDTAFSFVVSQFEFDNQGSTNFGLGGGNGGNAGGVAYIPNFYAVYRLNDDVSLTMAMAPTYGLETSYDADWVGRYHAIDSQLTNIDINPNIVYKVTDWLSLSAGASAQWIYAKLTQASPIFGSTGYIGDALVDVRGSSWSAGATAGATINYMEGGRIGFSWRSEVSQGLTGNQRINDKIVAPINCDLTLPQTFQLGLYQRGWGDFENFAVMADYAWTGWSVFKYLDIQNSDTGDTMGGKPVHENWKNTSRVALGFHYYPEFDQNMVLRCGAAWDESPIRGSAYRTVRIPCSDRIWISGGVGYKYKNMTFDFGYSYIMFYDNSKIASEGTSGGAMNTIRGEYKGHAHVISLQAGLWW